MMAAGSRTTRLIERLPAVRGRYTEDAPLAKLTRFRVGGPAEVRFRPVDAEDLAAFLAAKPADVPVTVIGVGSNLLVRDGGVPGVVLRLGREFAAIDADGTIGEGRLHEQCAYYLDLFEIAEEDLVHVSYSDLLLQMLQT